MRLGLRSLKAMAVAGALMLMPVAASALSVLPGSNITAGGSYEINGGPYFWGALFPGGEGAGSVSFLFNNASTSSTSSMAQGIALQFAGHFDGLTASWANGESQSFAAGETGFFNISTILNSGASDTLTLAWGAVTEIGTFVALGIEAGPAITSAPVPAAGLMLLTGLGGLALTRRKRRKVRPA